MNTCRTTDESENLNSARAASATLDAEAAQGRGGQNFLPYLFIDAADTVPATGRSTKVSLG